jgi:hypothetical protein
MTRFRRYFSAHRWRTLAVAGVAVIALGGGVAYAALDGSSTSIAATSPTTATSTTLPASGSTTGSTSKRGRHLRVLRGQITAISGSTWTVESRDGIAITVVITPTTQFGTRAAPSSQSSFNVGNQVGVAGTRTGPTTVTATRIVVPRTTAESSTAS